MIDHEQLRRDGCVLLRGAVPADWLAPLRDTFDRCALPSHAWPVPRGQDWQHAQLDLDPQVQATCRLPPLLESVGVLIGERFFLAQAEGREPRAGGGQQGLHRDGAMQRPGDTASALVFFDDYGPQNGATRYIAGTHRDAALAAPTHADEARAVQLAGAAGDIFVFDANLVHGGTRNPGSLRRRSMLVTWFAEAHHAAHLRTAAIRGVRMDTSERFDPPRA